MICDLIVIGCGGTGGHYVNNLGRFLHSYNYKTEFNLKIILVDGDVVEKKNLTRQPFLVQDIGRKKAEVMAEVMYQVYGVPCEYVDHYIDYIDDIKKLVREDAVVLLVGAVDNHQCRQTMHDFFEESDTCIYMDSANEYSVGEIVVGAHIGGIEMYPDRSAYFPEVLMEKGVRRSEESCEALNESAPQHLVTNLMAANLLLINTVQFFAEKQWQGGMYLFDAFKGYCQSRNPEAVIENNGHSRHF